MNICIYIPISQHIRTISQFFGTFELAWWIYVYTYLYPCVVASCDVWRTYATWQRVIRGYSTVSIIAGLPLLECVHVWHMPGTSCIVHLSESCTHHAYLEFACVPMSHPLQRDDACACSAPSNRRITNAIYSRQQRAIRGLSTVSIVAGLPLLDI